ncbi:MAG: hypothetical protein OXI01_08355 [Albidovulum sp.]|nr:hypothetical protein [Albidovulum sp.]
MPKFTYFDFVSCLAGSEINLYALDVAIGGLAHSQTVPLSGKVLPLAETPDFRRL